MLRQLLERDFIRISGRSSELGRPFLYGTTKRFLQIFGLRHLDELPERDHTTVRYEDLCRDPAAALERLYAFCGVDPARARDPLGDVAEQHLLGNRRRLGAWTEIRLDDRWRTELPVAEQERALELGGAVQRRLYPEGRPQPLT